MGIITSVLLVIYLYSDAFVVIALSVIAMLISTFVTSLQSRIFKNLKDDGKKSSDSNYSLAIRTTDEENVENFEESTALITSNSEDTELFDHNYIYRVYGQLSSIDNHDKILLTKCHMLVGRNEECDIFLSNTSISRRHAVIEIIEDNIPNTYHLEIKDLQSLNGTFVNDYKIKAMTSVPVQNGDLIEFGNLKFKYDQFFWNTD